MSGTASPTNIVVPISTGSVHGGQQAIQGARIYLFAASTSGYGGASTSLLTGAGTVNDSTGNYVTTDVNGSFAYGGKFTCPGGSQVYLLALGGNPGLTSGTQNSAIALSAALGPCSGLNSGTHTFINEVTTVGMAYALKAFMVDPTHVSAPSSNAAGLQTAFATAKNLVDNTTGTALATTPAGNGVAPQQYLNTLANIIAACVNSSSGTSTTCAQLFNYTTITNAAAPHETFSALANIAAFPAAQTANLYSIASAIAPFQPTLTSQPSDFSLGVTYSPTAITAVQPTAVVIDATGNIWMANCQSCLNPTAPDSLLVFSPTGAFLHSYTGSTVPGTQVLHEIKGIALDATSTNIYIVNQGIPGGPAGGVGDDQLIKMATATGVVQSGFPLDYDQATYGVDTFNGVAVDNAGRIWTTATNTGAIVEQDTNGNLINGSPFFIGGTLGVAADNTSNVFFAGIGGNNIIQFDTNGNFLQNFTPAGLNQPIGMAINASNELLTINVGNKSLSKVEFFNGANGSNSPYTSLGIFSASVTAIDGTSQVIIPNCRASCPSSGSSLPDNLLRVSQAGVPNAGAGGGSGAAIPTFSGVSGAAIDASGNVWVSDNVNGKLTEVIGYAAPTIQPLAKASSNGSIGQLP